MSQGVENRGSLISVPLALREITQNRSCQGLRVTHKKFLPGIPCLTDLQCKEVMSISVIMFSSYIKHLNKTFFGAKDHL